MISRLFLSLAMKCTAGNFSFQTCFSLENDFPKRNMIEKRSYPLVIKHGNGTFLFMRMRIDTVEYLEGTRGVVDVSSSCARKTYSNSRWKTRS